MSQKRKLSKTNLIAFADTAGNIVDNRKAINIIHLNPKMAFDLGPYDMLNRQRKYGLNQYFSSYVL